MAGALKVTHAVLSLDAGGLERVVVDLVREGQKLGQQVSVVCVERPGTLAPHVEALGALLRCLDKPPGIRLRAFGRMKAVLTELRPDVLHTHQVGPLFYAGPPARRLGVPLVVHTEHTNAFSLAAAGSLGRLKMAWLWWWAGRYAARFFCVSKNAVDELAARRIVPREKLVVLLNGIDTAKFRADSDRASLRRSLGIPAEAPVIGSVGRLDEVKRQDLLIRVFATVKKRFADAHLLLVGDGPMRPALERLVQDLGLGSSVHLAGYQSKPELFLPIMNVFALTSRLEGLPLAVLEAWAAGLPVVSSAVGGLPDLIEHGRTGLLFANGDEAALLACLVELLADPSRARHLAEAGQHEAVTRYDLRRMAADYERHYHELLSHKGHRAASAT